ncbi:hypothetical protein ACLOJK_013677 [Asimina triloba]
MLSVAFRSRAALLADVQIPWGHAAINPMKSSAFLNHHPAMTSTPTLPHVGPKFPVPVVITQPWNMPRPSPLVRPCCQSDGREFASSSKRTVPKTAAFHRVRRKRSWHAKQLRPSCTCKTTEACQTAFPPSDNASISNFGSRGLVYTGCIGSSAHIVKSTPLHLKGNACESGPLGRASTELDGGCSEGKVYRKFANGPKPYPSDHQWLAIIVYDGLQIN